MIDRIDTATEREWLERLKNRPLSASDRASLMVTFSVTLDALDAERVRAEKAEAERDQALARLAAAYEAASALPGTSDWRWRFEPSWSAHELAEAIRALTPADAEAALQRVVDAAWNEAVESCAWSFDDDTTAQQARQTILALKRPEASHE